jgi:hypothetical protein
MSWGGLNPALTSWRNGINGLFPDRSTTSDGGYADAVHGSSSQHQPDADGTVDAFDMDNNLLRSGEPNGSDAERALLEALKLDFEADPRAHLWISHREIAQHDIENWEEKTYGGDSPHDEHTHWQSHEQNEDDGRPWDFTHTLTAMGDLMTPKQFTELFIAALSDPTVKKMMQGFPWQYYGSPLEPNNRSTAWILSDIQKYGPAIAEIQATLDAITNPTATAADTVALLRGLLGDRAHAIGAQLAAG